jgi:DNA repair protein SbcC/Rad50
VIPLSLTLRNFLSYGPDDTVVGFGGMDVVCICGANGVGKSALLDGMLWALYGVSRLGAGDYKSLIRKGAKEAAVMLDFAFEGGKYRVDRRVYRDGKRSEEFRFYHLTGDGELSPIAQGRDGKRALEELLRLSAESFTASVFLHQGESDLFSRADPRIRRKILGNILELELYERFAEQAKEESKSARQKSQVLRGTMEDGGALKAELATWQDELSRLEEQLAVVKEEKEQADKALGDAAHALAELQKQADLLEELRKQTDQLEEEVIRINERIVALSERLADCEKQTARIPVLKKDAAKLAGLEHRLEVLRKSRERLLEIKSELDRLAKDESEQAHRLEKEISELANRLNLLHAEATRSDEVLARADAIRADYDELLLKSAQLEEMRSTEKQQTAWQTELAELESQHQKAHQELETKLAVVQSRITQYDAALGEEEALQSRLVALGDVKTQREELAAKKLELTNSMAELEKQRELLQGQYLEIKSSIKVLESRLAELDHVEGDCPLCKRPLDEHSRYAAHSSINHEITDKRALLDEITANGLAIKKELNSITANITSIDTELSKLPDPTGEIASLASKLADLEKAKTERAESAQTAEQLQSAIAGGDYAREILPRIEELGCLIAESGFDPAKKAQLEKEVIALTPAQRDYDDLQRIEKARPQLEADARKLQDEIATLEKELTQGGWRKQIAAKRLKLETERSASIYSDEELRKVEDEAKALKDAPQALKLAEAAEKQIPTHRNDLAAAEQELEGKVTRKQELDAKLGGADELAGKIRSAQQVVDEKTNTVKKIQDKLDEQKQQHYQVSSDIKSLQARLGTIQKLTAECTALDHQSRVAEFAAQMFSSRGIPHLIIAGVLPQVSQIATELLAQLSDDPSASIHLNPQKAKADGELADSLDIVISDRNGERNYALYSGGESFRIDIALRVALAKLLARRSGVSIRTLVIDEGFGTQDSEGIDRLASVVHRLGKNGGVGGSFDLVMVVTHVEELKNRFEQLLVVEKDSSGYSTVKRIGANR